MDLTDRGADDVDEDRSGQHDHAGQEVAGGDECDCWNGWIGAVQLDLGVSGDSYMVDFDW